MQLTLDTPLIGIQRGQQTVRQAASRIARSGPGEPSSDLTESLVQLKRGKHQVQASAKALEVENRLLGSLLDIEV